MKVGIVSLWWLPVLGGSEIYVYRLAEALREAAVDVSVATATKASPDSMRNGAFDVARLSELDPPGDFSNFEVFRNNGGYKKWCDNVFKWCLKNNLTHVLFNQLMDDPLVDLLVNNLQSRKVKVGFILHDASFEVNRRVSCSYSRTNDWKLSIEECITALKTRDPNLNLLPSFHSPVDFFVLNSDWTAQFLGAVNTKPRLTLHPPLQPSTQNRSNKGNLKKVTISILNPGLWKGVLAVAQIMLYANPNWTFRIHKGGWGDDGIVLRNLISQGLCKEAQVEFIDYVENMQEFYNATDLFLFPSVVEGYGMAAVEAVFAQVPLITSDYPAISEGVGEYAITVPSAAGVASWISAINSALTSRDDWSARANKRIRYLETRQKDELHALINLLLVI